jgi:hypothetical protein
MKKINIEGRNGYQINLEKIERYIIDGEEICFIPCKFQRNTFETENISNFIKEDKSKKNICDLLSCSETKLNNYLQRTFKTSKLSKIKDLLSTSSAQQLLN